MKREIKFRGLGTNGVWYFGNFIQGAMHGCAIRVEVDIPPSMSEPGGDTQVTYDTVRNESVGQFTGLLDKNGKEIYEGDIVKQYGPNRFICTYQQNMTAFVFKSTDDGEIFTTSQFLSIEVVGNVYENPYLLAINLKEDEG